MIDIICRHPNLEWKNIWDVLWNVPWRRNEHVRPLSAPPWHFGITERSADACEALSVIQIMLVHI